MRTKVFTVVPFRTSSLFGTYRSLLLVCKNEIIVYKKFSLWVGAIPIIVLSLYLIAKALQAVGKKKKKNLLSDLSKGEIERDEILSIKRNYSISYDEINQIELKKRGGIRAGIYISIFKKNNKKREFFSPFYFLDEFYKGSTDKFYIYLNAIFSQICKNYDIIFITN